jgi:hypothetical protein
MVRGISRQIHEKINGGRLIAVCEGVQSELRQRIGLLTIRCIFQGLQMATIDASKKLRPKKNLKHQKLTLEPFAFSKVLGEVFFRMRFPAQSLIQSCECGHHVWIEHGMGATDAVVTHDPVPVLTILPNLPHTLEILRDPKAPEKT